MRSKNIPHQVGELGENYWSQVGKLLKWRWDGPEHDGQCCKVSYLPKGRDMVHAIFKGPHL